MDWKDVGGAVKKFAPILGTALGGPVGGAIGGVVSLIASAFGIEEEAISPDTIMQAIQGDPAAAIKLREIEANTKIELQKIILEQERMNLADRADARNREVKITQATGTKDINLYVLAWTVIFGFFILCGVLMFNPLPDGSSKVVFMLFGGLATGFGTVLQYFFGSSRSSQDKTQLLALGPAKNTQG